jgi:hypothetical protein
MGNGEWKMENGKWKMENGKILVHRCHFSFYILN